jgi:hypothetical protein
MNHLTYPNAIYPLQGDCISQVGDSNVVVVGLQRASVLNTQPQNGDFLVYQQNDSPFVADWCPTPWGIIKVYVEPSSSPAGVLEIDASLGNSFYINVNTDIHSMNIINPVDGQQIELLFVQDSTGWSITLAPNIVTDITPQVGANEVTSIYLSYSLTPGSSPLSGNWYQILYPISGGGGSGVTEIDTTLPVTGGPITTTGTIGVNKATSGTLGVVQPDNTTITIDGSGVISSVGGTDTDYYQTVQQAGSDKTQEPKLNFKAPIIATDNAGVSTDIEVPVMVGDSGSGGVKGLVPAPGVGDAPTKFLNADGTFRVPSSSGGTVTAVTGVAPIASTNGTTPAISLQNSSGVNVTVALGTDTEYFTASGSAATDGHVVTGDAQGGIKDSGTTLISLTSGAIGVTIDGGGSVPSTGFHGYIQIPYNCTITGWTMLGNVGGAAQITVKRSTYAAFPSTSSIVASLPPNIPATNQKNTSTTLTSWGITITVGDVLEFNLDSIATITWLILQLQVTKT